MIRAAVLFAFIAAVARPAESGECGKDINRPVRERVYGKGNVDIDGDGKPETVEFVLVSGTVTWDACGMFTTTWYSGKIEIRVLKNETILSTLDFTKVLATIPAWTGSYPVDRAGGQKAIEFGNFLHDGRVEFPILWNYSGDYKLFAVSKTGEIEVLSKVFQEIDENQPLSTDGFVAAGDFFLVYKPHFRSWGRNMDWAAYKWDGHEIIDGDKDAALKLVGSRDIAAVDPYDIVVSYLSSKSYSADAPSGVADQPKGHRFEKALELLRIDRPSLARNEIYARHGYAFAKTPWSNLFSKASWYTASDDFDETKLTAQEKRTAEALRGSGQSLKAPW
ncbi:MAG TPA: YARHG domain-containing protein [Elusimicrobiota bacterium]|nr:YARHG domain-containing protein [Elusimicrobiota bacterium]